jgi:ketosteroid isomerase-like protein
MAMAEAEELADALAAGIEGRDPDGFVAVLAPGAIVWHNHDRKEVDAIENMASVAILAQMVDGLKSDTLHLAPTADGFVFQFVVRGTVNSNGKPFEMHNCIIATTADGKITRIDEYVDPTIGAQFS